MSVLEERAGWKRALERVNRGEADGIAMHVDTLRLLVAADWEDLKKLGLDVGVFKRYERETS